MKCVRSHILKMLYRYISVHTDIRNNCGSSHTMDDFRNLIKDIRRRIQEEQEASLIESVEPSTPVRRDKYWISWYNRHKYEAENGEEKKPIVNKDDLINLKTSFLHGAEDDNWCSSVPADDESDQGTGIFGAMFG